MNRLRPPGFRSAVGENRSATWTELFYDLAFVVAIRQLVLWLPETSGAIDFAEFALFMLVFWWTWASFTFFTDRYDRRSLSQFILMLVQVGAVVAMAAIIGDDYRYRARLDSPELPQLADVSRAFAVAYVVSRAALVALYFSEWLSDRAVRPLVNGYLAGFSFETVLWSYSIFAPDGLRLALWLGAITVSFGTPFAVRYQQALSPLRIEHFPERFWLFTIIVMGESLAAIVLGLGRAEWALSSAVIGFAGVAVTVALWWIYFSSVEGASEVVRRNQPPAPDWRPTTWIYSHLPLMAGIVVCGVGFEHLLEAAAHDEHNAGFAMAPAGLAVAVLSVGVIFISSRMRTSRPFLARGSIRVVAAALAVAAIPVGHLAGPEWLALNLAVVAIGLVAIDALNEPDLESGSGPRSTVSPGGAG